MRFSMNIMRTSSTSLYVLDMVAFSRTVFLNHVSSASPRCHSPYSMWNIINGTPTLGSPQAHRLGATCVSMTKCQACISSHYKRMWGPAWFGEFIYAWPQTSQTRLRITSDCQHGSHSLLLPTPPVRKNSRNSLRSKFAFPPSFKTKSSLNRPLAHRRRSLHRAVRSKKHGRRRPRCHPNLRHQPRKRMRHYRRRLSRRLWSIRLQRLQHYDDLRWIPI